MTSTTQSAKGKRWIELISQVNLEVCAWWVLEIGVTLGMVLGSIVAGIALIGTGLGAAFASIVGPGDLIIFSVVLIGSASAAGLATIPDAVIHLNGSKTKLRMHAVQKHISLVCIVSIVCLLFVIGYVMAYCLVKVVILKIEHSTIPIDHETRHLHQMLCAMVSSVACVASIFLAATIRRVIHAHLLDIEHGNV